MIKNKNKKRGMREKNEYHAVPVPNPSSGMVAPEFNTTDILSPGWKWSFKKKKKKKKNLTHVINNPVSRPQ